MSIALERKPGAEGRRGPATWISKTPGVCGGDACVRDTRIMVWLLEDLRRIGQSEADILAQYPGLTMQDLALAREYAAEHADEIGLAIRENEEA